MPGRNKIYTNYNRIDETNILEVLRNAFPIHQENAGRIDTLLDYEEGEVNAIREKVYRREIQNFIPDPLSSYIVDFKLGFEWGNPITIVQSDDVNDENSKESNTKAVSIVNRDYRTQMITMKQQELARYIEVGGIGYTYIDVNTEYEDGDSFFTIDTLDPRYAFVVRSNAYTDKRIILGVSYRYNDNKEKLFSCFTKDERFEIKDYDEILVQEINPLKKIPIIEWIRSFDRQGCFERLIPLIDGLTAEVSAFLDGVQSNLDTIWWGSNVEFPTKIVEKEDGTTEEEVVKPKDGDWLLTYSPRDGKDPKVQPLTVNYDYKGQLENIVETRNHILKLAHVPQRNDNSGGSTGVAMDDAAGWNDAEAEAKRKEMLSNSSKMEELKVIMAAYKISQFVPEDSPLIKLRYSDCSPSFKRSKQYEMTVKTNAACALLSKGFALEDVLTNISMVEDPAQVIARSGEGVKRYQEINVFNNKNTDSEGKRPFPDLSDQETNSPLIGGTSKQDSVSVE